jgi:glycosyltransferase involved in cell wall biosynthesis
MVLLEAMSYGLPCVSFDCPSGPSEIIQHNNDGFLIEKESIPELTAAISMLITDETKRKKMGIAASAHISRFSPEAVYKKWSEKVFI